MTVGNNLLIIVQKVSQRIEIDINCSSLEKKNCHTQHEFEIKLGKSVQNSEALKMSSLAIFETTVGLSLSIYRWKALPEKNINI